MITFIIIVKKRRKVMNCLLYTSTTRNLDKAIGYGFTTIGIKVVFLTSVSQKFPFSLDTVAFKVVTFTIDRCV